MKVHKTSKQVFNPTLSLLLFRLSGEVYLRSRASFRCSVKLLILINVNQLCFLRLLKRKIYYHQINLIKFSTRVVKNVWQE